MEQFLSALGFWHELDFVEGRLRRLEPDGGKLGLDGGRVPAGEYFLHPLDEILGRAEGHS